MSTATIETMDLLELVASPAASVRVDAEHGRIRGVRILNERSKNNRRYLPAAITAAARLYEGVRVGLDHPAKPGDARGVDAIVGWLEGVRVINGGKALEGDLCVFKSDPRGQKLLEAAQRRPDLLGLSHNAEGEVKDRDGISLVERITRVRSVDIVTDPATTHGLFESVREFSQPDDDAADYAAALTFRGPILESAAADIDPDRAARESLKATIDGVFADPALDLAHVVERVAAILATRKAALKPEGDEPAPTTEGFLRALGVSPQGKDISESQRFASAITSNLS